MASPSASPSPSPPASRTTSATESAGHLTPTATWTSEQEARLTYCQDQLKQAQKKWSDRQELWIREVDHLLDQKRAYAKAQKRKQTARAEKALRLWKARTWKKGPLARTLSGADTTTTAAGLGAVDGDGDVGGDGDGADNVNDDEDDEDEDPSSRGGGGVERSDGFPQRPPTTSSSPTQPNGLNPFRKLIRRMSSASFPR